MERPQGAHPQRRPLREADHQGPPRTNDIDLDEAHGRKDDQRGPPERGC